MEKKGLVIRQSVPQDARLKKIVLTPKALEVHEMVQQDAAHFEGVLTKDFSKEEFELLLSYLERMKKNMQELVK
jgi:DNA-binding MarR family transcriptional regulator